MIVEFLELTFSRHDTCKLLCDTSLALARSSPTRRYTGNIRLWLRLWANCPSGYGSSSAFLHYICILTWETFQIKASLAFKSRLAFCIGIHVTLLSRVSPSKRQREVSRVFQRKKWDKIWTRVLLCFYLFQMAKTICQLVAWFKDARVTQKSVPVGRVGRSVGHGSCWSVGSLKLIKIIIFGRSSFVLRPHLNVKN